MVCSAPGRVSRIRIGAASGVNELVVLFGAGALLEDVAGLDELLEIVGDVRAQIVAARAELAGSHFGVADVEHQQGLDRVDVVPPHAVELVLDQVEQTAVQAFDPTNSF